jgi:predicted DNA-binding ribbon-helix-helix protein
MAATHNNIIRHSIMLVGHKTSVSLEDQFWNGLREIACSEQTTVTALVEKIDMDRNSNLSSAIRLFVLDYFRAHQSADISVRPDPPVERTGPSAGPVDSGRRKPESKSKNRRRQLQRGHLDGTF